MNVVFLSPHFPPHFERFCQALRAAGASVLGIGDEAYQDLSPTLRSALNEYYRVDDMHDDDALVRACGFLTHKFGKLDRFESLNEYWLATEARLREDFNIYGVRPGQIDAIRRKSHMKANFVKAGVQVARGQVVHAPADAKALIRQTGYPVIAKPDDGVGALNTFRIDNDSQLAAFFENKPATDYFMEEFITGTIFSFDGLTDRNGRLVFYTAHTFSQGIMETVNENRHIYYYSLREIPETLEHIGRACLKAFDVRERFFHIEFFRTGDEDYVALEVNMRPPGGYTTDMFNYASNIDIYRAWAELLVRGKTRLSYGRPYHCCYASRKNHLNYLHSHDDIMSRYQRLMQQVEKVPGVFSSALGDQGYIFRSPRLEEVEEIVHYIHQLKD